MAGGSFSFNAPSLSVTTGLTLSFERGVATIDPTGATVASADPRFDADLLLAGVEDLTPFVSSGSSTASSIVFDSGYDHNGTDQLMVVHLTSRAKLRVYTNPNDPGSAYYNDTNLTLLTLSSNSYPPTGGVGVNAFSLGNADIAYIPQSACVCHGFIALSCTVLTRTIVSGNAVWDFVGSALLHSVDQGSNWALLFDDLANPVQAYLYRGNHWCLQKYFVPYPEAGGEVLEAWLVATDYRIPQWNEHEETGVEAVGGRFFVVRITREEVGEEWTAGDGGDSNAVIFDMDDITPSGYLNSRHAHVGGIVKRGTTGVRFVGSLGDDYLKNRFVTATLSSHSGSYTDTGDWTIHDFYHGRSQQIFDTDPAPPDDGVYNPQSAGMLDARVYLSTEDPTALFLGADNTSETISLIRCPSDATSLPTIEHVHGVDTGFSLQDGAPNYFWGLVQQFRTLAPELGTPIVSMSGEEGGSANAIRYWYQPGAEFPDLLGQWAGFMVRRNAVNVWAVPFGDRIFFSGQAGDEPSLAWRHAPTVISQRPVIVSPGGRNMILSQFRYDSLSSDNVLVALTKNGSGQWIDGVGGPVLDPQPPTLCDRVFRISTVQTSDNLIGRLGISALPPNVSNQTGWVTGPQLRQVRFYVRDNSPSSLSGLPRPSTALLSMCLRNDNTYNIDTHSKCRVSNQSRWIPHTLAYDNFNMSSGPRIVLRVSELPEGAVSAPSNESYFYLAADMAKDGEGSFSYPQLPQTVTSAPWAAGADEQLTITGFGLDESFTLLVAGMMPENDWNHRTPRSTGYWPLFTLWADSDNWIEFGAVVQFEAIGSPPVRVDKGSFRVRYNANGSGPVEVDWSSETRSGHLPNVYWSRNSQLIVGISYQPPVSPATSGTLRLIASLGGEPPVRQSALGLDVTFPTEFDFDTLKFRSVDDEVVTFRWFGGEAVDGTAMTFSQMESHFASLDFLE